MDSFLFSHLSLEDWAFGVGFFSFIGSILFSVARHKCKSCRKIAKETRLLKERLAFYASMQFTDEGKTLLPYDPSWGCERSGVCVATCHKPAAFVLTSNQHRILLGILKKVEAKSAALATVIVFGLATIATILVGSEGIDAIAKITLHAMAGVLFALLIGSVDGANHLGQRDYAMLSKRTDQPIRGRQLQKQLLADAVMKEERLASAWWLLLLVFLLAFSACMSQALCLGNWLVG